MAWESILADAAVVLAIVAPFVAKVLRVVRDELERIDDELAECRRWRRERDRESGRPTDDDTVPVKVPKRSSVFPRSRKARRRRAE